jgi:hypothetical protein
MTIRKTGAVTGQIIGVENAETEPAPVEGQEPEANEDLPGFVDRPLQGRPVPAGDDD